MERAELMPDQPNTEILSLILAKPATLAPLPTRAKLRIDNEEPHFKKSNALKLAPERINERTDIEDPIVNVSSVDKQEPSRANERTDKDEPLSAESITDNWYVEPRWAIPITDTLLPKRKKLRIDKLLPMLP
jgi:hypothetical protein